MKGKAIPKLQIPEKSVAESLSALERRAEGLSARALDRARQIARLIESERSPTPFVFPTEVGGVQFEWKSNERALDIEVLPDGAHLAFLTMVADRMTAEGEIADNCDAAVCSLLNWMTAPALTAKPSLAV